ncbi:MAG: hypothetical protein JWM35_1316 [Verrucomicrobia bacterium]|nr:hypothetical protein [Verrucomicrobiota bacterium]
MHERIQYVDTYGSEALDVPENRVLVLAPTGNDAGLTVDFLRRAQHAAVVCTDIADLCREIGAGCLIVVLAEEALDSASGPQLGTVLRAQPPWSDLPIALISSSGDASRAQLQRIAGFSLGNNITLLERPFHPATLLSTVQAGISSRLRQYQVRTLLMEVQRNAQRATLISEAAAELQLAKKPRASLPRIFQRLATALDVSAGMLHLQSTDAAVFNLIFSLGLSPGAEAEFATLRNPKAWCRALDGDLDSPEKTRWKSLTDTNVVACQLLQTGDRLFGTVVFARRDLEPFSPKEIQALGTVSDLAAASLDRARLIDELSSARDTAEHASKSKDEFLAALSHELRTPLNPIMLLASEASQNEELPAFVREDFETIRKNVTLEARLIDDLLDLTRITRGKLHLDVQPLALQNVLREAIDTTRPDAAEKRLELVLDLQAPDVIVNADEVRLLQVFWNVLKNAVKFTPHGGRVEVRAREIMATNHAVIEVEDSGVGMTPEEISRAFQPFTQGDHALVSSPHRFGGLGLGLAISHALIGLHRGSITATSPGRDLGAVVRIELPLAAMPEKPASAMSSPPIAKARTSTGARILLVEDHENTRTSMTRLLTRRGYIVTATDSMSAARKIAACESFDAVISDLGLPDGTGYDLMADLQLKYGLKGIALSGYGMEQDLERSREAGFSDHLVKPVEVAALEASLQRILANSS